MKKKVRSYLAFTRGERNAALLMLTAILVVMILPAFLRFFSGKPDHSQWLLIQDFIHNRELADNLYLDSTAIKIDEPPENELQHQYQFTDAQVWSNPIALFNPDTISVQQWKNWGVPEQVAIRMQKYVAKGGRLQTADDLKKVYGFPEERADIIGNFIAGEVQEQQSVLTSTAETREPYTGPAIELNSATESQLIAAGFSVNEAKRIIRFRDQAGGFFQVDQLYSIFGVDAAHIQALENWLQVNEKMVILINLNTTDSATLAAHVYISNELAGELIQYRKTTGKFYSVKEVTKVKGMYPALFEKLKPYLRI